MDIKQQKIDSLIFYENNNKTHPEKQIDLLANSIKEYGFNSPVIVDKNNIIIAGHGRVLAAKKLGLKEVPTLKKEDLSDAQVKKYRLLDNKLAELAEDDLEAIKIELEELGDIELSELFIQKEEIDFDNIDGNEDREVSDKSKEVECPECGHLFKI